MSEQVKYGDEMFVVVQCGGRCIHCDDPVGVNAIPADTYDEERKQYRNGWMCEECSCQECDRCNEMIPMDEELRPYDVFGEDDYPALFEDGSFFVCEDCLTDEERTKWEKTNSEDET